MPDRFPEHLAFLYDVFGADLINNIGSGDTFEVDGVEFVCQYRPESTADRFFIVKLPELIARYREISRQNRGGVFFELGIAEGGSTALLALDADPRRLVAIDLEPTPLESLTELIDRRGLADSVRPRYGVDQSDRARLHQIVADDLGGEAIDVVFDDCSHLLELTRASFDALFPFVRPGGLYVIEDWNLDLVFRETFAAVLRDKGSPENAELAEAIRRSLRDRARLASPPPPPQPPLARLALELSLACATANDVIAGVTVDEHWITVRRGPADVPPDTFYILAEAARHYPAEALGRFLADARGPVTG